MTASAAPKYPVCLRLVVIVGLSALLWAAIVTGIGVVL